MKYLDIRWIKEHYSLSVATEGVVDEVYDIRVRARLTKEEIIEEIYDLIDNAIEYYDEQAHDVERINELLKRVQMLKDAIVELEEVFYA